MSTDLDLSEEFVNQFQQDGYAVIRNFLSMDEVEQLKVGVREIVDKYCQHVPVSTFKHGQAVELHSRNNYFAESADKIRGFYEEKAVVDGQVVIEEKARAINKIGHALHQLEEPFKTVTFSPKVQQVLKKLTKMVKPTVIQSMIIFKQPKVGGEVTAHQDSTYLYAEPHMGSLLGFWFALDEANEANGCLHFHPGSHHKGQVYQRFVTNPDETSTEAFIHTGEPLPLEMDKLVPCPAKPGDLVLIDGLVIHHSAPNTSDKSRLAYTFHVLDMNATYSKVNWLQPTANGNFVPMHDFDIQCQM